MIENPSKIIFIIITVVSITFLQVWCTSQYNETAFNITRLNGKKTDLENKQRNLQIELERLKSPARIMAWSKEFKLNKPSSEQEDILK